METINQQQQSQHSNQQPVLNGNNNLPANVNSMHQMDHVAIAPHSHLLNHIQMQQHGNNSRNPSNLDFIPNNPNDLLFSQRQGSNLFIPSFRPYNGQSLPGASRMANGASYMPQRFAPPHYGNTIGDDNDISANLKPIYKNYNIDVTQWPLTNPPIFENVMPNYEGFEPSNVMQHMPDGQEPFHVMTEKDRSRRRVSISNGQIDQLNNDLLQMDQLYCSQPPIYPRLLLNNNLPLNNMVRNNTNEVLNQPSEQTELDSAKQIAQNASEDGPVVKNESDVSDLSKSSGKQSTGKKTGAKRILPPSNTLIPGTPEYKKARLLERNRIAAMKCRQRKKLERDLMERDYDKLIAENKELKKKIQALETLLLNKN